MILPQAPQQFSLAGWYHPAEKIGGDWYGCYWDHVNQRLYVCMGDVTGHGIASSLLTVAIAGSIETNIARLKQNPLSLDQSLELLRQGADEIITSRSDKIEKWMTMCFLGFDLINDQGCYLNAGHLPVVIKEKNKINGMVHPGSQLGKGLGCQWKSQYFPITRPSTFLLYTDGLIENQGRRGRPLGKQAIKRFTRESSGAEDLVDAIKTKAQDHWQHKRVDDDTTVLAIELKEVRSRPNTKAQSA